jgi:2,5-dioxopentanoate dehydrogenase
MILGKSIIGGKETSLGKVVFKSFNPLKNEDNLWNFIEATPEEVQQSLEMAQEAFSNYRNSTQKSRAEFLLQIKAELELSKESILTCYQLESGLAQVRAQGEFDRTINQIVAFSEMLANNQLFSETIHQGDKNRLPIPQPRLRKTMLPIGPVVVFGASNFPFAYSTAGGDTVSALSAGCPVIVKAHPMHPATGELVARAISKAVSKTKMPKGVFSYILASGHEIGKLLVENPIVKGVGFTGSIRGGVALHKIAQQRIEPIPVFAEMGSCNPLLVGNEILDKEMDFWTSNLCNSITGSAGQFCTKPGWIFIQNGKMGDAFVETLVSKMNLLEPFCMLHPTIHSNFEKGLQIIQKENGVSTLTELKVNQKANHGVPTLHQTTLQNFKNNELLQEELFGPCSMVIRYEDMNELKSFIDSMQGHLTGTFLLTPDEIINYETIIEAMKYKVGRVILNNVPTGLEINEAVNHGGPFPATTDNRFTAVGIHAVKRWLRPVVFQNFES